MHVVLQAQARKAQPSSVKSAPAAAPAAANGGRNGRDDSFWDQASSTMQVCAAHRSNGKVGRRNELPAP